MTAPLMSVEITRPADVTDRQHRKFSNEALRGAAVHHKLVSARRHFEINSDTREGGAYGFVKRTKAHMIRKARKHGHQNPNVFSGRERAHVLANARVTATHVKARVIYRSLHSRSAQQADRWIREMETVSSDEQLSAVQVAAGSYHRQLTQHRAQRQRTRLSH